MKRHILMICVVLLATVAFAQDKPPTGGRPSGGRTVTATRSVSKYTGLETRVFQALQGTDQAAAGALLTDDFESWAAEKLPPTPRADWLQTFVGNLKTFRLHNMAVHDYGEISVVSFLLERSGTVNGKPMSPVLFIVDVWRGDKLAVRYASAPANPAPVQDAPTGKQ